MYDMTQSKNQRSNVVLCMNGIVTSLCLMSVISNVLKPTGETVSQD